MRYDEYDRVALTRAVDDLWEIDGLRLLRALISIPAQSPGFDPQWERTGDLRRAVELVRQWAASRAVNGLEAQVVDGPGLSPMLLLEIPGTGRHATEDTVVFYGHLDKQPAGAGWRPACCRRGARRASIRSRRCAANSAAPQAR